MVSANRYQQLTLWNRVISFFLIKSTHSICPKVTRNHYFPEQWQPYSQFPHHHPDKLMWYWDVWRINCSGLHKRAMICCSSLHVCGSFVIQQGFHQKIFGLKKKRERCTAENQLIPMPLHGRILFSLSQAQWNLRAQWLESSFKLRREQNSSSCVISQLILAVSVFPVESAWSKTNQLVLQGGNKATGNKNNKSLYFTIKKQYALREWLLQYYITVFDIAN